MVFVASRKTDCYKEKYLFIITSSFLTDTIIILAQFYQAALPYFVANKKNKCSPHYHWKDTLVNTVALIQKLPKQKPLFSLTVGQKSPFSLCSSNPLPIMSQSRRR